MRFITAASVLLSLLMASEGKELLNRQASCDTYVVSNMTGGFRTRTFIDFSNAQEGDNTQQFLVANSFYTSNWDVYIDPGPLTHTFTPNNVKLGNGALELKVSAHPGGNAKVVSAEIGTTYSFKYGSVRTYLKSSTTPGVCEGNFLYANRFNEVDWEILTSTIDTDAPCVPKGIWATNQALVEGGQKTSDIVPFTFDPRADFHGKVFFPITERV
ncbi:hypothetical protein CC2G_009432 [Coprinopsis cinerea AmutBmut pab1-1]|nr:hypothetical protein CC2G_009432 [Coprinopsis cinerea AmutBmut pab1-1]